MKTFLCEMLLLATEVLFMPAVSGQTDAAGFDTVFITKPSRDFCLYKVTDYNRVKEIQFQGKSPEIIHYNVNPVLRDIGGNVMTAITGIGFGSSLAANWRVDGKIIGNDALPDWNVSLFCEGSLEKNRERVREDDGSWSVETEETCILYWDKNATGIIMEGADTVGFFLIRMNPREDTLLHTCSATAFPQQTNGKPKKMKWSCSWIPVPGIDYGIIGIFRKEKFVIITDGTARKAWIFEDNALKCVFRHDLDKRGLLKKYLIKPCLLMDKNTSASERQDLLRLAIMSRYLSHALSSE